MTERQSDRKTDWLTERQTDRQKNRLTERPEGSKKKKNMNAPLNLQSEFLHCYAIIRNEQKYDCEKMCGASIKFLLWRENSFN